MKLTKKEKEISKKFQDYDKYKRLPKNLKKLKNMAPKRERNYNSLFKLLERYFPGWIDHYYIREMGNFDFLMEKDLKELVKFGFLNKSPFEAWDKNHNKLGYKTDHYRLSPQGFNFLNNLRNRTTNKILVWITIMIAIVTGIQLYILLS